MATVTTAWTNPAGATLDKATGNTVDETMTDAWSSDLYSLGGTAGYIGCRASMAATQSTNNGTTTQIILGAENFDSDPNGAMHDNSTNPTRITARTTGVYHITGYGEWAANATGYRQASIMHQTTTYLAHNKSMAITDGTISLVSVSTTWLMTAGEYVELILTQTSGGALTVNAGALSMIKA